MQKHKGACENMKTSKRILSLLLTIVMMLSIVPLAAVQSSAATVTLAQLQAKYPHGKYWNGGNANSYTSSPCTHHGNCSYSGSCGCNSFKGHAIQCMGFAYQLAYLVYGGDPYVDWTSNKNVSALNSLKPGDVVRYKNNGHSIFVTGVSGETVTYADCNSDGHCIIRWNQTISKATLRASFSYVDPAPYAWNSGPVSCNCSTSYAGNYICTTSSAPLTIRSGHGTSYSAIGSIPSGATVYVSKANGTWAHVTYNGVSGYASMEYLKKQGSSHAETPTMKWWISDSEWGDVPSSFKQGNRYYLCYKLYDSVTGKDWNSVSSNNYKVKLTYYYPDGSVFYSNEVSNADSNWISSFFVKTGTYKYSVEVTGDFTFSGSRNFVVNENPKKIYANTTAVNLKLGSTESMTIYAWTEGYCDKDTVLNWSTNNNNVTCSWGEWTNGKAPLTIKANSTGSTVITLAVKEKDSGTVLHSIKVNVYIKTNPFHITYDANGGSPSFSEPTDSYGKITITNRQPEKTGYTFSGWNANPNANSGSSILVSGKTITLTQDMTFYAIWQPNTYTVKYNANGGTGTMANSSHIYDTAKNLNANGFTRTGYNFAGWSTSSAATATQYADKASVKNLTSTNGATVNLYARWKPIEYRVNYNANGGTGTTANSSHTYDTAKALTENGFTRTGYTFLGWSTNPTATTATYTNKQSVKNLTATNGATVTLYAVWQKNPVTVSSISIQSKPTKTVYTVGEKFDASGLAVKVTMSDSTTKTITSGFTVSNPDMSTAGTKTVTVTYSGKTASFTITVNPKTVVTNGTLKIGSQTAVVGKTVQIPISVENVNLSILTLTVHYDKSKLKYVSCTDTVFDMIDVNSSTAGKLVFAGIADKGFSNGKILLLTFEVIATDACNTQITATVNDAYTPQEKPQTLAVENGTVKITKGLLGDLNGDGKVNSIDARWALQVASGNRTLTAEQRAVADVNGDGKVNAIDARWLLQVASGNRVL